jgi:hypothetical protein
MKWFRIAHIDFALYRKLQVVGRDAQLDWIHDKSLVQSMRVAVHMLSLATDANAGDYAKQTRLSLYRYVQN